MDLVQAKRPDNIDGTPRYANPSSKRVIYTSTCRMAPICLHCSHSGDDEQFAYGTRHRPESDPNRTRIVAEVIEVDSVPAGPGHAFMSWANFSA